MAQLLFATNAPLLFILAAKVMIFKSYVDVLHVYVDITRIRGKKHVYVEINHVYVYTWKKPHIRGKNHVNLEIIVIAM